MSLTKHYKTFFSKDIFYLYEYNNGIAAFRTQVIEDGFLSYYDIIAVIHDDSLGVMENEFGENFEYSIDDIFSHSDYISEINQHDVFTVKSDILFSNVEKQIHEKGL
jgi:hypothetical protein